MPFVPHRPSVATLALALGLAVCSGPTLAQYRWKDSRGQLHASDQPPPASIPDRDVLQRPAPRLSAAPAAAPASAASAPSGTGAAARVDPELQARRNRLEQAARDRAQADEARAAALRAENCQRARQHLATLQSGTRLVRVDGKGEQVVLDDAARAAEAAQARQVMATDCR